MGEIADMMLDQMLFGPWDLEGYEDDGFHEKTCNRCGADNLRWEEARGERNQLCWVLVDVDTAEVHVCPMASPSEFKDLTK